MRTWRNRLSNRGLEWCGALFLAWSLGAGQAASAQPKTIPALREWTEGTGSFTCTATSRILLEAGSATALQVTAATLMEDLLQVTGTPLSVFPDASDARAGDIILALGATDAAIGQEGYLLQVTDRVRISAISETGVFYGTRSLLQMLRQGLQIQAGSARDWPDYPERALMVDVGRKLFSVEWLQRHIKELAYLKLNVLHLHLSDVDKVGGYGFRLESTTHPEITSSQHYSKAEIQSLLALAQDYHVTIVPEIDVPAHATPLLAPHPELALAGSADKLDLSKPAAWQLVKELLDEFVPLFPGPRWHLGGDEYLGASEYANYPQLLARAKVLYGSNATAPDLTIGFFNYLDGVLKGYGKQAIALNDCSAVPGVVNTLNADIALDVWSPGPILAQDALNQGHEITNGGLFTLYYVLAAEYGQIFTNDPANIVNLYENWAPHKQWVSAWDSSQWPKLTFTWAPDLPIRTPGLRGAKFFVWSDYPDYQTEAQVQEGIAPHLRGLAQNCWGSPKLAATYDAVHGAVAEPVAHAPGWGPDYALVAPVLEETVTAGQTGVFHVQVKSLEGFNQPVQLSCQLMDPSAPLGCLLSTTTVTPGQEVTVSLSTNAPYLARLGPDRELPLGGMLCGLLVPGLWVGSRRSRRRLTVALLCLVGFLISHLACGSSSQPKTPVPGTPPGQYTVILNATSGGLTHSVVLSLTVR